MITFSLPNNSVLKTGFLPKLDSLQASSGAVDQQIATQRYKMETSAAKPRPQTPQPRQATVVTISNSASFPYLIPKGTTAKNQPTNKPPNPTVQLLSQFLNLLKIAGGQYKPSMSELRSLITGLSKYAPYDSETALQNLRNIKPRLYRCLKDIAPANLEQLFETLKNLLIEISNDYKKEDIYEILFIPSYLILNKVDQALALAKGFLNVERKNSALYAIIQFYIDNKKPDDASRILKEINVTFYEDNVIADIALLYSPLNPAKAAEMAKLIQNTETQSTILYKVCKEYLFRKLPDEATKIAKSIVLPSYQNQAYFKIFNYFFRLNQIKQALAYANCIKDLQLKSSALCTVANLYLKDFNKLHMAYDLAKKIPVQNDKDTVLADLGDAFLFHKLPASSLFLIEDIDDMLIKSNSLYKIAQYFFDINDIKLAHAVAKMIPNALIKCDMLCACANAFRSMSDEVGRNLVLLDLPKMFTVYPDMVSLSHPLDDILHPNQPTQVNLLTPESRNQLQILNSKSPTFDQVLVNFYYKVLGSNPLNFHAMELPGLDPNFESWISDLDNLMAAPQLDPIFKKKLTQIINELSFAQQTSFANKNSVNQENILIYHLLNRLHHLPLPQNADNAPYSSIILEGGTTLHVVVYMITRKNAQTFTFSIINSGDEAPVHPDIAGIVKAIQDSRAKCHEIETLIKHAPTAQASLTLKIKLEQEQTLCTDLTKKLKNLKIGNLTYTDLTENQLSDNFFKTLLRNNLKTDMKKVLSDLDKILAKPDRSNFHIQGRLHKYQGLQNCSVKAISLALHERAGNALHNHIKAQITQNLITQLETFLLNWKNDKQIHPDKLITAQRMLEEGKKVLSKRVYKALH